MSNPLEGGPGVSPPAPNPDAGQNAMMQGAPQQQQRAPAPPTHEQVVAFLRHADAVKEELATLLKNPSLGKSDVKSQVIDGVVKLTSQRFMSPAQAVIQLSSVPTDPIAQRKWVQTLMAQTVQSEQGILAHHAQGFAGQGPQPTPSADSHMDTMQSLSANYGGK